MADLSVKITANFEEAVRQFKKLAKESESAQEKIKKFTEKFDGEKVEKFTDKQKLAGSAITATKGSITAMLSQQAAYAREIERLIKNGLSPESDAIKRLQDEYVSISSTIQAATDAQEAHEQAAQYTVEGLKLIEEASKSALEKLTEFTEIFDTEQINNFTDSQKEAGKAITAVKDSMMAMNNAHTTYAWVIEWLIGNGLSPEIEAVKKLRDEYDSLASKIQAVADAEKNKQSAFNGLNNENSTPVGGEEGGSDKEEIDYKKDEEEKTNFMVTSLENRLRLLGETEEQAAAEKERMENERKEQVKQFVQSRLDAENLEGEARIEYLGKQKDEIINSLNNQYTEELNSYAQKMEDIGVIETQYAELAAENKEAVIAAIDEIEKEQKEKEKKDLEEKSQNILNVTANVFGHLSGLSTQIGTLFESMGQDNRGFVITARALSATQAGINSALAFTTVLTDPTPKPWWQKLFEATSVLGAGIAQQAAIWSAPIPSAETGGRFMVPDVSSRVDSAYLRVNPGETVDVTPRSMTGSNEGIFNINLLIDGSVLASVINKKARAGELYTLQLAGNL